ncbi:MAG: hypothetical protein AAFU77_11915 [Myxococcota bacterium]
MFGSESSAFSPVFERVCDALEKDNRHTLTRLQCRGLVRLALQKAGLTPRSVSLDEMRVVLERVLPDALRRAGIEQPDAGSLSHEIHASLKTYSPSPADTPEAPESVFERLAAARKLAGNIK